MVEEKSLNLMSKYVSNDLTLEETEELLDWLGNDQQRAQILKEFQEVWDLSRTYPESFHVNTRAAWQKVNYAIGSTRQQQRPRFTLTGLYRVLVIGCLAVILLGVLLILLV